jgi:hypothetical protein
MKKLSFVIAVMLLVVLLPATACQDDGGKTQTSAPVESTGTGDETARLFDLTSQTGQLGAELEQKEAATFAGCWIEHQPEFHFVIAFTRDGEETIKKYVKEGSPLAEIIELRTFGVTYEELKAAQQETMQLLNELGLFCDNSINVQENQVEVYVTDSKLFHQTLQEAEARLPDQVTAIVVYEPLREVPFQVNPDPSVHFPQLKMHSGSVMAAILTGELVLKDGYLCIRDTIIIWQPDYFLNNNNGTIEILDRDGKVVARVGEEVVMGGGGIESLEHVNRMLKEPLPPDCQGPFWLQGGGTRLSLNFSSDLFSLEVILFKDHDFYFMKKKPPLDKAAVLKREITGKFVASYGETLLRCPHIHVEAKPAENKGSVQYTTFWPADYQARVENGIFEIIDGSGNVVLRDGENVKIEGRVLSGGVLGTSGQLLEELPGGCFGPYLVVDKVLY